MSKLLLAVGVFFFLSPIAFSLPPGKPKVITKEAAREVFDYARIEALEGLTGKQGREGREELFKRLFGERVEDGLLDRLESTDTKTTEAARQEYVDKFLKLVTAEGREGLLQLDAADAGDLPLVRQARGLRSSDIAPPTAAHKEFGKKLQIGTETVEAKNDALAMATRFDPSGATATTLRESFKNDPEGRTVRSVRDLLRTEEANRAGVAGEVEGTVQTGAGGAAVTREMPPERRAEFHDVVDVLLTDLVSRGHLTPTDITEAGSNARIQAHDHALASESARSESPINWTGFSTMSKLAKDSITQALKNKLRDMGENAKDLEALSLKQLEAKLKSKTGDKYDKALAEVAAEAKRLIAQGVLARLIENARAQPGPDGKPGPLMKRETLKSLFACAPAAVVSAIIFAGVMLPPTPVQAGEKSTQKSDKKCSYDINDPDGICFDDDIKEAAKAELARRANGEAGDPSAEGDKGGNHPGGDTGPAMPKKRPTKG